MDVTVACEDVRSKGEMVNTAAVEFVKDTMSPEWRAKMVSAARDLLMSVTRLLVVVDMIDVDKILTISSRVSGIGMGCRVDHLRTSCLFRLEIDRGRCSEKS